MRTFLALLSICFISFTFMPADAEAKRMFGGKKSGKSLFSTQSSAKKAPTSVNGTPLKNNADTPKAPTAAATGTKAGAARPGMGGILGGMLAGGLLASLFMGGGFEGLQMMDILLIGLGIFFIMKLFGQPKRHLAAGHQTGHQTGFERAAPFDYAQQDAEQSSGSTSFLNTPAGFDQAAFLTGAKDHFASLQQAWDSKNWQELESYLSPELFEHMRTVREAQGPAVESSKVIDAQVELSQADHNAQQAMLLLEFNVSVQHGDGQEAEYYREFWHMQRDLQADNAPWLIVGIEQAEASAA